MKKVIYILFAGMIPVFAIGQQFKGGSGDGHASRGSLGFITLPVKLVSFKANCKENQITFNWTVAMEQNNDYFSIERSADGQNFQMIGKVKGAGNSSIVKNYEFIYDLPDVHEADTYFYRLKQTDINGQSETFPPISISCAGYSDFTISATPNPSSGNFVLSVNGKKDEDLVVKITDIYGKELYYKTLLEDASSFLLTVDLENKLAPGIYFVTASCNEKIINRKIVVK